MREHAGDLGSGELRVERDRGGTGAVDGRIGDDPTQEVGRFEMEGDPVAGADTVFHETVRDPAGGSVPFGEGQRGPADDLVPDLVAEGRRHRVELFRRDLEHFAASALLVEQRM